MEKSLRKKKIMDKWKWIKGREKEGGTDEKKSESEQENRFKEGMHNNKKIMDK